MTAVHMLCTLWMTGLVWFVQVVHYPLMAFVDRERHPEFAHQHAKRTGWVVAPMMLTELATGILLAIRPVPQQGMWQLGLGILATVWVSTFAVQVPLHGKLAHGFDEQVHRKLVNSNWVRTALWSVRSGIVVWAAFG